MTPQEIIAKKRDHHDLSREEIRFFIQRLVQEKITDYQATALLMAIYLNGMTLQETAHLTQAMVDNGKSLSFSETFPHVYDKHSTGGVGDKVSLILAPLLASMGLKIPMISGRGLGHSGGTLDKLESIPGFCTRLSDQEALQQIEEIGFVMMGQTRAIAPADRILYALRDATATVSSIPLITASILSKKLAEGLHGLVMDVKIGSGAFMRTREEADQLVASIQKTAALHRLPTAVLMTDMEQPLGLAVGNWLETREAIRALQGEGPADLMTVTFYLCAQLLVMAKKASSVEQGIELCQKQIKSGKPYKAFEAMVEKQGGDSSVIRDPLSFPMATKSQVILAEKDGFIKCLDALTMGQTVVKLGGGRENRDSPIDLKAGIVFEKKVGDKVKKGDKIATLFSDRPITRNTLKFANKGISISDTKVPPRNCIIDTLASPLEN